MEQILQAVQAAFAPIAAARPFLDHWPDLTAPRRAVPASSLPVCAVLPHLSVAPETAAAFTAIQNAAPSLNWRQTYGAEAFGAAFLQAYGWSEFIGLRGPVASDTIACGVLLLGPGTTYPAHAHQAEEVYLPIAGLAEWQSGDAPFAPVPPGQPVHHLPWMPHAMRCGDQGLAALYLWRGGDLAARSVILGR
jgi:Dimethlysulfonioproprionate lyase